MVGAVFILIWFSSAHFTRTVTLQFKSCFFKRSLMVTKVICLIKNSKFVIIITMKQIVSFQFIFVMQSWIFSIITPVFRHMILLKSLQYADLVLSCRYQCWKHWWWIENRREQQFSVFVYFFLFTVCMCTVYIYYVYKDSYTAYV